MSCNGRFNGLLSANPNWDEIALLKDGDIVRITTRFNGLLSANPNWDSWTEEGGARKN